MSDSNEDGAVFSYGDWVEFQLNTNLFGIVVGFDALGLNAEADSNVINFTRAKALRAGTKTKGAA